MRLREIMNLQIVFVLMIILLTACIKQVDNDTETYLEFTLGPCDNNVSYSESDNVEKQWIDDNTLKIIVHVSANCCSKIKNDGYEIMDDKIIIKYKDTSDTVCYCICNYDLTYTFHNLENKDYGIGIKDMTSYQ